MIYNIQGVGDVINALYPISEYELVDLPPATECPTEEELLYTIIASCGALVMDSLRNADMYKTCG